MANKYKNINSKNGRLNLLVMRSKGQVTTLSISPFTLFFALLFGAAFIAVSVVIINRYYALYYDHQELEAVHRATAQELHRLRSLYSYQSSVASEYAKIMNAMNRADPQSGLDVSVPAIGELPPVEDPATEGEGPDAGGALIASADEWAALFPDPPATTEQILDIENLQISGRNFRFQLTNKAGDGTQVQGRLLMVFVVEDGQGRQILQPYPDFDVNSSDPDFNAGPGYNIRSSKQIAGRLNIPADGLILEMAAVAKSRDGQVALKKKIAPPRQ